MEDSAPSGEVPVQLLGGSSVDRPVIDGDRMCPNRGLNVAVCGGARRDSCGERQQRYPRGHQTQCDPSGGDVWTHLAHLVSDRGRMTAPGWSCCGVANTRVDFTNSARTYPSIRRACPWGSLDRRSGRRRGRRSRGHYDGRVGCGRLTTAVAPDRHASAQRERQQPDEKGRAHVSLLR